MESSEQSNVTSVPTAPSTNFPLSQDHMTGMSNSVTPSKRPNDGSLTEPTGKRKLQNSAGRLQNQSFNSSLGCTVFRVLCPDSKVERIAGNGGAIISEICKETSANITVGESFPGCDERLIVIVGSHEGTEVSSKMSQEVKNQEANAEDGGENPKPVKEQKDKEPDPDENSTTKLGAAYAQKALLCVFERLVGGEVGSSEGDDGADKSPLVLRLLVFSGQVNCVLGKSGSTIKKMSADTGAEIRMLAKDQLPSIASASDRLVQIKGDSEAIGRALQSISQQIIDSVTRDSEVSAIKPSEPSVNSVSRRASHNMPKRPATQGSFSHGPGPRGVGDFHLRGPPIPLFHETGFHGQIKPPSEALTYRLLSSTDRVGIIIGKGGAVVKTIEQETGCDIKVLEGASDSDERIIVISGPAHPDDRVSPVQDALLRVQNRIIRASPESKEISMTARMLVLSNQIGCLLGKGGSIIAEMRRSTGAYIRILGKDQIPKCASDNEEVIQVTGEYDSVQEALVQITNRLRHHFFFSRDPFHSIDHPSNLTRLDPMPTYPSSMGRRDLSPSGMYSNFGPPIHNFDSAPGPHGGFHPHEDRPPFMHDSFRAGLPPNIHERRPWGPEGPLEGVGPIGHPEFLGGLPRRGPGFGGGGNQAPIITSTTIEVVVPRSVVTSIYGEDGWSLKQVRQISDANIVITEPKPGDTETVIVISGTPEQTQAAQSLIQAFVMCERE